MDPITAVSLVGVIIQFVELGTNVAKRLADFIAAVDNVPQTYRQILEELPLIALKPVVEGCLRQTEKLDVILKKALPSAGSNRLERGLKALSSVIYDKSIEQIGESLNGYKTTLIFHQVIESGRFARLKIDEQPPPYPKAFWLVPFDRNTSFVGRDEIFVDIEHAFEVQEGSQPRVSLCGLGGIGKSQVALEYCYRRLKKNERCSVFWVNAATVARFEESFKHIANACDIIAPQDAQSDAVSLLKNWLEVRHEDDWLMVIDNVDDQDAFFHQKTTFGKTPFACIPHCERGTLLFTSRSRDVASDVACTTEPIMIREMSKAEGIELVRKRLSDKYSEDVVVELLQEVEYIPLALTQAIAFMIKRRKNIHQYLELYRKSDSMKTKFLSFEFADHARQEGSVESVAKTWRLSFEYTRSSNRRAADLLCLISFFQYQGIPISLLHGEDEDEDDFDFQEAAALLRTFSFIDDNERDSMISTHRLVQLATRWWLEEELPLEVDRWALLALRSVTSQFPPDEPAPEPDYFKICELLLPHAEVMLKYQFKSVSQDVELVKAKLLKLTGNYLWWYGNHDEMRLRLEQSMEINTKYLGEKAEETMDSAGALGELLTVSYHDVKAVPLLERLLENRREVFGEDDPRTNDCLSTLAVAVATMRDYARSEEMQREAFDRSVRILGREHDETLNCMEYLARVLSWQDKMDEAIRLQRQVCDIRKRKNGARHRVVLIAENNLALMLAHDKETASDAVEIHRRILEISRDVFGVDHLETLLTAYNLIQEPAHNNSLEERIELAKRTLAEAADGPRNDDTSSQHTLDQISTWLKKHGN